MSNAHHILEGCHILIVEDEALIAFELIDALEKQGASTIGPIARVKDILPAMSKQLPDVVILDLNLHGESSGLIATLLISKQIPVVIATGYLEADIAAQFPGLPILEKPYVLRDIVHVVSTLFKGKRGLPCQADAA